MHTQGPHLSDRDLVSSILGGNLHHFAYVVKQTEVLVGQIVKKMVPDPDDQKDLVQDIYIKVYQNLPSFRFTAKLSTWIAQIAYNTTLNHLKKRRIQVVNPDKLPVEPISSQENPELLSIRTESAAVLHQEIDKLPPMYQTVITLYHLLELPIPEIAAITSLPTGTIKSYLFRARNLLKENLRKNYNIQEP